MLNSFFKRDLTSKRKRRYSWSLQGLCMPLYIIQISIVVVVVAAAAVVVVIVVVVVTIYSI